MLRLKELLQKNLNELKRVYPNLKDCNGIFEKSENYYSYIIGKVSENEYNILCIDGILNIFDTQKATILKEYSFLEFSYSYNNNEIIFRYKNIPFGVINIKNDYNIEK